ncbi:MAG: hypothetical protein WBQ21_04305 [Solirubrobacteraceae bacterium]
MGILSLTCLSLFAAVAFGVIITASASAASPEWLVNGAAITGTTKIAVESVGSLSLADLDILIIDDGEILCEGSLDGTVSAGGGGEITEVLNTKKEAIGEKLTGKDLLCDEVEGCEGETPVWPIGLPWKTQLELSGASIVNNVFPATAKVLGWEMECDELGVIVDDECTQALLAPSLENMLTGSENDLLANFNEQDVANCTASGSGMTGDIMGVNLMFETAGASLIVSGDGVAE